MLYYKALHIIFVVTWFAGLFYFVRFIGSGVKLMMSHLFIFRFFPFVYSEKSPSLPALSKLVLPPVIKLIIDNNSKISLLGLRIF